MTTFIERHREIDGYDLHNIPHAAPHPAPRLPVYVPLIYHRNRRAEPLKIEAAALPLHKLYDKRERRLRYNSRAEIAAAFGISEDARLILIGCGRDKPIEVWWGLSSARAEIIAALARLGIELVTSPNYSLFTDLPRYDDMHNIKRIGIAWQEIVVGGISGALHLNARTAHDYERLSQFIQVREEVTEVAFEFATGVAWPARRPFHHKHLAQLAERVSRPLNLVMVGGVPAIPKLAPTFASLIYVDTSAFMKAMYRRRLVEGNDGKLKDVAELTPAGAPLDSLLARNIEVMRAYIERLVSESRAKPAEVRNILKPKSPDRAAFVRVAPSSGSGLGRQLSGRGRPTGNAGSRSGSRARETSS